MAEEILQTLGFDAKDALDTLERLDRAFLSFDKRLETTSQSFRLFNSNAGKTVAALKQIQRNADVAAAALNRVSGSSGPAFGGRTQSVNTADILQGAAAATRVNELLEGTSRRASQAGNSINNFANATEQSMNRARRSTASFAISFETLVRVVTTQAIVRSLNALQTAVTDSFDANLEFTRSLSEIQTLARDSSLDQLSSEVRELSDSFNIPLLDAAAAKFEILQNGFESAGEQTEVFTAATAFSKTAVADLATSVDVITGTLNAFGEEADQAEVVAAKLFRTVDQGKVVGTELARVLGRISPIAKELGVTLDEELAALGTITIAGVPASEAITQIRGAMTALIKPTDTAKEALRELGFENSEQLIQAEGLVGAFQALIGTTDGSTAALGKLFPRVRGLNGVIRLTGTGLETFQQQLENLANTDTAQFGDIFEQRISTDAERVERDLNRISNFFTVELGGSIVETLGNVLDFTGGVDTLIDGFRAIVPVATSAVALFGSVGVAIGTVNAATRLSKLSFDAAIPSLTRFNAGLFGAEVAATRAATAAQVLQGSVTGLFLGLGAVAVGDLIAERFDSVIDEARDSFNRLQDDRVRDNRAAAEQLASQESQLNKTLLSDFESLIADRRRLYFRDVDNARAANQDILTDYRDVLSRVTNVFEDSARVQENRAKQLADVIVDSQRRQAGIVEDLEERQFDLRNRRFSQTQQGINLERRAAQIAAEAARQLAGAQTSDDTRDATAAFQRARAAAEEALAIADQTGNVNLRLLAERRINQTINEQIAAEERLQEISESQRIASQAAAAQAQERVKQLNAAASQFLELSNLFDSQGNPLDPATIERNRAGATQALQEFFALSAGGFEQIRATDLIAFDQLQQKLASTVTGTELQQLLIAPNALQDLESQVLGTLNNIEAVIKLVPDGVEVEEAIAEFGTSAGLEAASSQISNLITEYDLLSKAQRDFDELQDQLLGRAGVQGQAVAAAFDNASTLSIRSFQRIANGTQLPIVSSKEFASAVVLVREQLIEAAQDASFTQEEFNQLFQEALKVRDLSSGGLFSTTAVAGIADAVDQLFQVQQIRNQLNQDFPEIIDGSALQRLEEVRARLEQLRTGFQDTGEATGNAANAAESTRNSLSSAVQPTDQLVANLTTAADAMERLRLSADGLSFSNIDPGGVLNSARGGRVNFLADGGFTSRGTDTIPAMLSPGETVINAESSRRFFSELIAINSGIRPSFRSEGGPVTNVGDVTVNVSGAQSPRATGREVVAEINRLTRRGSSRLK